MIDKFISKIIFIAIFNFFVFGLIFLMIDCTDAAASLRYTQQHFKIYQDNAGLNSATQYALEDTNYNIAPGTNFRLRIEISTNGLASGTLARRLKFSEDGGPYTQITTNSNNVRLVDSVNFTDGDATTSRLTATGTFVAGYGKDTSSDTSSTSLVTSRYIEDEWSLVFESGAAGHTYTFRIYNTADTVIDTYTITPTIVVTSSNTTPNIPTLISPSNASYTNDTTPTLSATYVDSDTGDTGTTNYRIATSAVNCTNNTSIIASGTSTATSTNNETTSWTPSSSIGNDGTYYWCAQNDDGTAQSAWTSMGSFTLDTQAPTNIAIQTITPNSSTELTITAQTAQDPSTGSGQAGSGLHTTPYYFVETTGNSGATSSSDFQTSTTYIDTGLTPNTIYTYKVKAKDTAGNQSDYSTTVSAYTLAPTPTNLTATVNSSQSITLSVDTLTNQTLNSSGYYFERTSNTQKNSGWIQINTWQDTDPNFSCSGEAYTVKYRNQQAQETSTISVTAKPLMCGGGGNEPQIPPVTSITPPVSVLKITPAQESIAPAVIQQILSMPVLQMTPEQKQIAITYIQERIIEALKQLIQIMIVQKGR